MCQYCFTYYVITWSSDSCILFTLERAFYTDRTQGFYSSLEGQALYISGTDNLSQIEYGVKNTKDFCDLQFAH